MASQSVQYVATVHHSPPPTLFGLTRSQGAGPLFRPEVCLFSASTISLEFIVIFLYREFLGRGRSILQQLPQRLITRTSDSDLVNEVQTDNSQSGVHQDIADIVQKKLLDFNFG